jgi:cbb3-type cytochrome oxidase maturation protein
MSVIYVALPVALLIAGVALLAFRWCLKQGQYDDLDTPAYRAIFDDQAKRSK